MLATINLFKVSNAVTRYCQWGNLFPSQGWLIGALLAGCVIFFEVNHTFKYTKWIVLVGCIVACGVLFISMHRDTVMHDHAIMATVNQIGINQNVVKIDTDNGTFVFDKADLDKHHDQSGDYVPLNAKDYSDIGGFFSDDSDWKANLSKNVAIYLSKSDIQSGEVENARQFFKHVVDKCN